ncbi:MAG: hypothetical protein IPM54_08490 [Polyangiaceae bacterium]|nr:hypothetical protein [Polyangiaceae bacterium]
MGWFSKPKQMRPIVRMCGTKPEWGRFDAEDVSHIERMIDAIKGDVHVVGASAHDGGPQAIRAAREEFENIQHVVERDQIPWNRASVYLLGRERHY